MIRYIIMDVIKAAIEFGPNVKDTLAITSEGTSYTYEHLLRSALSIAIDLKSIIDTQKLQVCANF